ncbi:MAG: hypothetical protein JW814_03620 [Candidatus Krumholzibacteriota bacterium]|nr:hypothetical protein [Candidatus Krumholzibacteriota bacterium]
MTEKSTFKKKMSIASPDPSAKSVLISVSDKLVQSALVDQLQRCYVEKIHLCDPDSLPDYITATSPEAIFAGVDESAVEMIAAARRVRFDGAIVAVVSEKNREAAKAVARAGADDIIIMPAREIKYDIIVEKLSIAKKPRQGAVDLLEKFLGPISQGAILLDRNREMIFLNKSARDILNASSKKEAFEFIRKRCPEGFFERIRTKQSAIVYMDVKLPDSSGHKLLGLEGNYLEADEGSNTYLILLHDFSEWKRLDQLRSSFITSLSHRMRTPLTSIRNVVKILTGSDDPAQNDRKEKLLGIGWRNIEKLISNLDELQKIFMIESEEMNVCRTVYAVRDEMDKLLENLQDNNKVKGYKISISDSMIFTEGGRLADFVTSVSAAYGVWLDEPPFIEISSSIHEETDLLGNSGKKLNIYLRPRTNGRSRYSRESFRDFLSFDEAHRGLVMERIVTALNGKLKISRGNTITLSIPLDPPFERKKDLIHPLHMMIERADISNAHFCLVDISLSCVAAERQYYSDLLLRCLMAKTGSDGVISRSEKDSNYSLFLSGWEIDKVVSTMREIRSLMIEVSRGRGDEDSVDLHWEIKFERKPGVSSPVLDDIVFTTLC